MWQISSIIESPNPWLKESFFVVVWSNTVCGFLLFLTRIEINPLEVVKDRERYGNAIEYSFVTDPFGTEEYSTCDAWYLGENYSRLTGTWYFPADQIQDGFAHIRLIGDGNVIYDNSELNADNCRIDFNIDVSGIRELSFEYNGICDMTDILFGMSDAKLCSWEIFK